MGDFFGFNKWMIDSSFNNIQDIFDSLGESINKTIDFSNKGLSEMLGNDVYKMLIKFSTNFIFPVAIVFLMVFVTINLSSNMIEINLEGNQALFKFIEYFAKIGIGAVILYNSFNIVNVIYDVPREISVLMAKEITQKDLSLDKRFDVDEYIYDSLTKDNLPTNWSPNVWEVLGYTAKYATDPFSMIDDIKNVETKHKEFRRYTFMENKGMSGLFWFFLSSTISRLIMTIVPIVIEIVLYIRIMRILLYVWISPIPISFLFSKHLNQNGINFLRNLFALGMQLAVIMILVFLYYTIQHTQYISFITSQSSVNLNTMAISLTSFGVLLISLIWGSEKFTKELLGVN